MNFIGTGTRLSDVDLPRIGAAIDVGEDEIHAVLDVEARGKGFDSQKRPVMLFEPHIFYRQLSGEQRNEAVHRNLAYPKWRRDYPSDSYPRLERALMINKDAALQSASWGLGQVMGFNHKLAGYDTAEAMVGAFMKGEAEQLAGMVSFIKNTGLDKHLRNHDWARFAQGYNGSGYAANQYDKKLAAAYQRWAAIPDTAWKQTLAIVTLHKEPDVTITASPVPTHTAEPANAPWWAHLFAAITRMFSK